MMDDVADVRWFTLAGFLIGILVVLSGLANRGECLVVNLGQAAVRMCRLHRRRANTILLTYLLASTAIFYCNDQDRRDASRWLF